VIRELLIKELDKQLSKNEKESPMSEDAVVAQIILHNSVKFDLLGEEVMMRYYMKLENQNLFDAFRCHDLNIPRDSVVSYVQFAPITSCGTTEELGIDEVEFLIRPM
jgi:hypothetical protein